MTKIALSAALLAAGLFVTAPVEAGPLVVRTSRPAYADTEIARPLTIAKEWAEFTLDYRFRDVSRVTGPNGKIHPAGYRYRMSWLTLGMRYGFTRDLTLFLDVPYSVGSQRTGAAPGDTRTIHATGMGDTRFGFGWQVYAREREAALTSVALQVDTKQPSGDGSAAAGGARSIELGTGTANLGLAVAGKQRLGPCAAVARAGYVHKFSAVAGWAPDHDAPSGFAARVKPGDEIDASVHVLAQALRRGELEAGLDYVHRENAAVGHTSRGLDPAAGLKTVAGSGFQALNASGRVIVEPDLHWSFSGGVAFPLMSRNSGFYFPLEDLSQSYGTTFLGSATFRW
jgi:hypothetical protein